MSDDPTGAGQRVTATVLAKLFDQTERQIYYHARNGVIPRPHEKRFDLIASIQSYIKHLRKRGGLSEGGAPTAKDRILTAKARQAEADADLMDGTAIHREVVEAAWIKLAATLRTNLLAIPSRTAPLIEAAPDLATIHALLTGALHDALSALSAGPVYAREPGGRGSGEPGRSDPDDTEDADAAAEADDFAVG